MSARLFPRAYILCGTLLYNNVLMKYCACQNNLETDECTSLKNSSGHINFFVKLRLAAAWSRLYPAQ